MKNMKYNNTENIVVVFIGDGTWGEGIVYETLNMASLWGVPLLIVVENNRYAQSTPIEKNLAGNIDKRVDSFNIKYDEIETNDIDILYPRLNKAIKYVRKNNKPFVQIINTYRLNAHSKGDDDRSQQEIDKWWKKDPLKYVENKIQSNEIRKIKIEVDSLLHLIKEKVKVMEFASIKK